MKQFYVIHYWYCREKAPFFEKDVFYGTIEDAKCLIYKMMEISPYEIKYAEIEELGNYDFYMRIDRPDELKWCWK